MPPVSGTGWNPLYDKKGMSLAPSKLQPQRVHPERVKRWGDAYLSMRLADHP